jgi:hypothetical protein
LLPHPGNNPLVTPSGLSCIILSLKSYQNVIAKFFISIPMVRYCTLKQEPILDCLSSFSIPWSIIEKANVRVTSLLKVHIGNPGVDIFGSFVLDDLYHPCRSDAFGPLFRCRSAAQLCLFISAQLHLIVAFGHTE